MGEIHTLIPAHRPTAKFEMPESQCAQKRKTSIIQAEVLETHTFPSKITAEPNIWRPQQPRLTFSEWHAWHVTIFFCTWGSRKPRRSSTWSAWDIWRLEPLQGSWQCWGFRRPDRSLGGVTSSVQGADVRVEEENMYYWISIIWIYCYTYLKTFRISLFCCLSSSLSMYAKVSSQITFRKGTLSLCSGSVRLWTDTNDVVFHQSEVLPA